MSTTINMINRAEIGIPIENSWRLKMESMTEGESLCVLSGSERTVRSIASREYHSKGTKYFTCQSDPLDPDNFRLWCISKEQYLKTRRVK